MKKRLLVITLGFILILTVACEKKETPKPTQKVKPDPIMQGPILAETQKGLPHSVSPARSGLQVVIPDSVKGKWSGVKIVVEDKVTKKASEYMVSLNSDFKIPDSNIRITVGEFLPDFRMDGNIITSASNQPNNPAVGVRVYEGDKQIFPAPGKQWGWLWARKVFQSIHPFEHPRYSIMLEEGVKKG